MADITRRRTGEFLRIVFQLLWDKPDGVPAKEILEAIPKAIKLTDYENGFYPSTPNSPRFEKIVRFATIDLVKAGWLVKNKGRWYLTEEGRLSYKKFADPEDFGGFLPVALGPARATRPGPRAPRAEATARSLTRCNSAAAAATSWAARSGWPSAG